MVIGFQLSVAVRKEQRVSAGLVEDRMGVEKIQPGFLRAGLGSGL